MSAEEGIRAQAIAWRIRLTKGDAEAWEDFVLWLEQSPDHGRAYDLVALGEEDAAEALAASQAVPVAANDDTPRRSRRTWASLGAAAAVLAVALVSAPMLRSGAYTVTTGPGEQREIALADGSHIVLNGNTRIGLDTNNPRLAKLEAGEAHFQVVHDSNAPFRVELGNDVVQDVGTAFDVLRDGEGNRVEVSQGAVVYNPDRENVSLKAGQTLTDPVGDDPVRLGQRASSSIGSWTTGRLSYDQESVARVAADVARALGVEVSVAPELADRRFSGTIRVGRDRARVMSRFAALLDASARRTGAGWLIEPRTRAVR